MNHRFRPGDLIVYRKSKHSRHPGPRAANIQPARKGDTYAYTVDKYWVVEEVLEDGSIVAATRRGKRHQIRGNDPQLKRASFLQRLLLRSRFSSITATSNSENELSTAQS